MDKQLRHDHIKKGNLKITLQNNSLEIYLLICDNTMNLGLFKNDGSYDQNRILNSNSEKSIQWANRLFETIKEGAI